MLRWVGIGLFALYERVMPMRKSECCAYRATSGRSPCFDFAKRAFSRYGFFKALSLVWLRTNECSEAAVALASSERRWRESLLAHPSVMSQFALDAEEWDRGDTMPMQWDDKGNFVPRAVRPPATPAGYAPHLSARVQGLSKGRVKVHARGCGPFVWPRQYGNSDTPAVPRNSAGLQPSH